MTADAWTIRARTAGLGVVSTATATAAARAVAKVAADDGRGVVGEASADLRDLRTDPAWSLSRRDTVAKARAIAEQSLLDALDAGLSDRMQEDAAGLGLVFDRTAQDRADLIGMPIISHTAAEHAAALAQALDFALAGAVVPPLLRPDEPGALSQRVTDAGQSFADKLGNLAGDAYQAGRALALSMMRAALV
jgi:hypothetical protein